MESKLVMDHTYTLHAKNKNNLTFIFCFMNNIINL
jgi:hypothetical protein